MASDTDTVHYRNCVIRRDPANTAYWNYREKSPGGMSGRVYASLKATKKEIDIRLKQRAAYQEGKKK